MKALSLLVVVVVIVVVVVLISSTPHRQPSLEWYPAHPRAGTPRGLDPATWQAQLRADKVAAQVAADKSLTRALQDELRNNFGLPGYRTPWYRNIQKAQVMGDTAVVYVDLGGDSPKLTNICMAVSGFVVDHSSLCQVKIMNTKGDVLLVHTLRVSIHP